MPTLLPNTFFNPKSIAVVGASASPQKLGSVVIRNLLQSDYRGKIFPVNPKYKELWSRECFAKLTDITEKIDMVVIAVPALAVEQVILQAGRKRCPVAIIITAGFAELGDEGAKAEQRIRKLAQKYGIRILGPNCLGLSVQSSHLNASFAPGMPREGKVAFLSQSGAVNTGILDLANEYGLGFSHFVSLGNKLDINEIDLLRVWLQDDDVQVIGMYLESFYDGKDMVDLIQRHPEKLVVVMHPGSSLAARKAMQSHTGSLAGDDVIVKTALQAAGAVQVDTFEDLFFALLLANRYPHPLGSRVAIVTNAGGPGIIATDAVIAQGLEMAKLSPQTLKSLQQLLPRNAIVHNPVDLVGDALADRYHLSLDVLLDDPDVDSVLVILTPQLVTQIEDTAKVINEAQSISEKPVLPIFIGGELTQVAARLFANNHLPAFTFPNQAVAALGHLSRRLQYKGVRAHKLPVPLWKPALTKRSAEIIKLRNGVVPMDMVIAMAAEAKIEMPRQKIVSSFDELMEFAAENEFPLVLKALPEDILHKTEAKAIYVNLQNSTDLHSAFFKLSHLLTHTYEKKQPRMLVQEQLQDYHEFLLGLHRNGNSDVYLPQGRGFGHLLVFGAGGVYTEVFADVTSTLVPTSKDGLRSFITKIKSNKIIKGVRGEPPLAIEKLVNTMWSLQQLAIAYPQISELDVNPLFLSETRCLAADIRIIFED